MRNLLESKAGKRLLFGALYLSEGAPIGFLWLALPTQMRAAGVPVERITAFTALLVIPWTFKFAWAPLVDMLRSPRWTHRHWIIACQSVMGLTLLPLLWLDPVEQFGWLVAILFGHALAAATQDVAIDALCISVTEPSERGQYNGWMQAGMLAGRAAMGGGALILGQYLGSQGVVLLLVLITTFSAVLVLCSKPEDVKSPPAGAAWLQVQNVLRNLVHAVRIRNTWVALLYAFLGGAVFKSLEVVIGPYLVDRRFSKAEIGWFTAGPMIGLMIVGALLGGWLADRIERRKCVGLAMGWIVLSVVGLAVSDALQTTARSPHVWWFLASAAFGIGLFTAASYALFMDLTQPAIAATQFSAFMGATNGCESWSSLAIGQLIAAFHPAGYQVGMLVMAGVSLLALPLLAALRLPKSAGGPELPSTSGVAQ